MISFEYLTGGFEPSETHPGAQSELVHVTEMSKMPEVPRGGVLEFKRWIEVLGGLWLVEVWVMEMVVKCFFFLVMVEMVGILGDGE